MRTKKGRLRKIERAERRKQKRLSRALNSGVRIGACCTPYDRNPCWKVWREEGLIRDLRLYLAHLPKADEANFFEQRRRYLNAEVGAGRHKKNFYSVLEDPDTLRQSLDYVQGPQQNMEAGIREGRRLLPTTSNGTSRVCQTFFLFVTQRSNSYLQGPSKRVYDPTAHDKTFLANRERASRAVDSKVTATVVAWLQEVKSDHLVMPNDNFTVLPYPTKKYAHAAYVLDYESKFEFEHSEASLKIFHHEMDENEEQNDDKDHCESLQLKASQAFAIEACSSSGSSGSGSGSSSSESETLIDYNTAYEEIQRLECQNDPQLAPFLIPVEEPPERKRKRSEYRYGNRLLGRKTQLGQCENISSYQFFCEIWSKFPEIGVRLRRWIPFAKCDTCTKVRIGLDKTKDKEERRKLNGELRDHLKFAKRERLSYATRRLRGKYLKKEYLSMIVDASDNSDYPIPHSYSKSHAIDNAWRLKMHLIGVLVHGVASFAYTCPSHMAQGNNITIQAIWDTIVNLRKRPEYAKGLPPVFYLQLDNTTKQCKGRWVMAYLAMLVDSGVFKKVLVSFLPVGHTHEDIDQFFSRIAVQLRCRDAHSRLALSEVIGESYRKHFGDPYVIHWDRVGNISGWLGNRVKPMEDITAYHQFRLMMNSEGKVSLQARRWPGSGEDDHWGDLKENSTEIYHPVFAKNAGPPNLFEEYDEVPPCARPDKPPKTEEIERTRADLERLFKYMDISEEDKEDCMKVFKAWSTPVETDIRFNWDKQEINRILYSASDKAKKAPDPVEKKDDFTSAKEKVRQGGFYLLKPGEDDTKLPFYICRVAKLEKQDGLAGARIRWLELEAKEYNKGPAVTDEVWLTGKYYYNVDTPDTKPPRALPYHAIGGYFQCEVVMTPTSGGRGGGFKMQKQSQRTVILLLNVEISFLFVGCLLCASFPWGGRRGDGYPGGVGSPGRLRGCPGTRAKAKKKTKKKTAAGK